MTYEVMISTARDINTPDEWLFDAAEKIQPAENELIVAVAENPNASEETIIELWLSVAIMNGENNIKMLTAEAIGAISNRVASEMLLDEIVEILKNNDCYWEIAEWERLRSILINGKNANYLREKFPEIIEIKQFTGIKVIAKKVYPGPIRQRTGFSPGIYHGSEILKIRGINGAHIPAKNKSFA